ncbi:CCA tRNA nucleotidyltransferase [Hamadaea tsunoensis]|uniref:CCA tRNA nucleotidyltransferase n=1 Tax=Hamadaea tsunoensis TaxID=53368 RepID=UPI000406867B|nr:CCA tRNA nucleotidyltransferase [Hamadaea tsunoensis]
MSNSNALTVAQREAVAALLARFPVADELGGRFADAGFELHLVGGSVRDALLGRLGDDLDFCTDAHPDETLRAVRGWAEATWETGREFGTIGAFRDGLRLEITTYRAESYDGVSRNPAVQYGSTLAEDLSRRDFTINAMAVSLQDHHFTDLFGGLDDLQTRIIRTPGTPQQSFGDDPLRMLRAARFAAQLRFVVDEPVMRAMSDLSGQLTRITAERVREEFSKLMLGEDPVTGLRLLVETGLAEIFLPELTALRMEIDEHAQHKDVYEHTLTVVQNAVNLDTADTGPDLVLRLSALLHDIGKPDTKAVDADGRVSFHHHELVGARMAKHRLKTLKYPKEVISSVVGLIALHLRFYGYGRGEWTDSAVRRYVHDAEDLLPRLHKLTRSDCTTRNKRKAAQLSADYDALEERIARIAEEEDLAKVRPDLDGNAIMELLDIPPGPVVGRAWKHLKEVRLERGPLTREEAESELRAWATENL